MASVLDTLYGPLSKKYCFYFYILSVFGFISLVLLVVSSLVIGITQKKGLTFYIQMISVAVVYGMLYLQNRLLFNMCSHSL
jgi:hypothetical protein